MNGSTESGDLAADSADPCPAASSGEDISAFLEPVGIRQVTLRDVPWCWSDLAWGLAPLVGVRAAAAWIDVAALSAGIRWLLLLLTPLGMVWMAVFPLWIARRRRAPLRRWSMQKMSLEAAIAVPTLLGVWLVLGLATAAWLLLTGRPPPTNPIEPIAREGGQVLAAALMILAVTAAPISEEVFFRGMLYNGLRQRLGPAAAAILQAAVFGFLHTFGAAHAALATLLGVALALVYEWRRTLAAPIILHTLQNVSAVAVTVAAVVASANAPVLGIYGSPETRGCRVERVLPDSGAEAAGLQVGDVVTSLDGRPVVNIADVAAIIRFKQAGDAVEVRYLRGAEAHQIRVILKKRS